MMALSTLARLCFTNFVLVGFCLGFLANYNKRCGWEDTEEVKTLIKYLVGGYFSIHLITWYFVFSFFYQWVLGVGLSYTVESFTGLRYEGLATSLIEIIFGYWAAKEILGGWCDLESKKNCIQNPEGSCDSWALNNLAKGVQHMCEYFTYDYDEEIDVYYRESGANNNNICVYIFRYMGHFIMTLISSSFTFLLYLHSVD